MQLIKTLNGLNMKAYISSETFHNPEGFHLSDIYRDRVDCESYGIQDHEADGVEEIEVADDHFDHNYYSFFNQVDELMLYSESLGHWLTEKEKEKEQA